MHIQFFSFISVHLLTVMSSYLKQKLVELFVLSNQATGYASQ